jgi:hypothetical protein
MLKTEFSGHAKPPQADRRYFARFPCPHLSPVRLILLPGFPPVWGFTWDASTAALGLLLPRPLQAGTVLEMELGQGQVEHLDRLTARVIHATPLPKGGWRLGCQLSRDLREEEL